MSQLRAKVPASKAPRSQARDAHFTDTGDKAGKADGPPDHTQSKWLVWDWNADF